jgi:hypothetical protein
MRRHATAAARPKEPASPEILTPSAARRVLPVMTVRHNPARARLGIVISLPEVVVAPRMVVVAPRMVVVALRMVVALRLAVVALRMVVVALRLAVVAPRRQVALAEAVRRGVAGRLEGMSVAARVRCLMGVVSLRATRSSVRPTPCPAVRARPSTRAAMPDSSSAASAAGQAGSLCSTLAWARSLASVARWSLGDLRAPLRSS